MTDRFADSKHKEQAEEFMSTLGNFVLVFEHICEMMRYCIMAIFEREGLKNKALSAVVVADKTAAGLQEFLGSLYASLRTEDEEDRKAIKEVLKRIHKLSETRNILVHSTWGFGDKASSSELFAASIHSKAKQSKGLVIEVHGYSASYVRELTRKAEETLDAVKKLYACMSVSGLKVSTELRVEHNHHMHNRPVPASLPPAGERQR